MNAIFKALRNGVSYLLFQVIIPNVIWLVLLSIPSAIFAVKAIISSVSSIIDGQPIPTNVLVTAGIGTLICLLALLSNILFVLFRFLRKKEPPVNQFPPTLETTYKINDAEYEIYFKDREHIFQRQTIHFEVTAPELRSIPHTMQWTGSSYKATTLDAQSLQQGYQLLEREKSSSIFGFDVLFPEKKVAGDVGTYSFETELEDAAHDMIPILARLIKCKTDKTTVKVTAPLGYIHSCEKLVSADVPCRLILSGPEPVTLEKVGEYSCYRFEFTKPELLRYYILRWKWARTE